MTARKRFFTVECSLYREPWPREVKLSLVLLGIHMTDRWAADNLTPEQATVAHLAIGDLLTITGTETRDDAHDMLRKMASVVTINITHLDNGYTRVEWRKLAETQWSHTPKQGPNRARIGPKRGPKPGPSYPHPHPHPHPHPEDSEAEAEEEKNPEAAAEPAARVGLPDPGPVANLLGTHGAHPPPEPDERAAWLDAFWPEIAMAADAELPDAASDRQRGAARARIALARWRTYLHGDRSFRGAAELARVRAESARRTAAQRGQPLPVYPAAALTIHKVNT